MVEMRHGRRGNLVQSVNCIPLRAVRMLKSKGVFGSTMYNGGGRVILENQDMHLMGDNRLY